MGAQRLLRPAANCTVSLLDMDLFSSLSLLQISLSKETGSSVTHWDASLALSINYTVRVCFLEPPSKVAASFTWRKT